MFDPGLSRPPVSQPTTDTTKPDTVTPADAIRVLFADDDEQFRTGLSRRLQRAGFHCDPVESGSDAFHRLGETAYDVLLADIDMPGNQALELVTELPAVAPTLPVVLLTGRPTVETATRSVGLKVAAYLVKPPDFDELCRALNTAAAAHRELRRVTESRTRLQDWEKELARLQSLLEQPSDAIRRSTMRSYLRLTLRNLVVGLVELEQLLVSNDDPSAAEAVERHELVAALRKTVTVLEKTRGQFKSKDLGELRKEIETLLS